MVSLYQLIGRKHLYGHIWNSGDLYNTVSIIQNKTIPNIPSNEIKHLFLTEDPLPTNLASSFLLKSIQQTNKQTDRQTNRHVRLQSCTWNIALII